MGVKRIIKEDKGAVLPFVALLLAFVLLGFAAIVVDAGTLYNARKTMVTAADAGALAGAMEMEKSLGKSGSELINIQTKAKQIARSVALKNGADGAEGKLLVSIKQQTVNLPSGPELRDVIEVVVTMNQKLTFARIFGVNESNVDAKAVATWGYTRKLTGGQFLPLFTLDTLVKPAGEIVYLHNKFVVDGSLNGNWGWVGEFGQNKDMQKILSGETISESIEIHSTIYGQQGNIASMFNNTGLPLRFDNAFNSSTDPIERKVFMRGLVPVIAHDTLTVQGSSLTLPILHFAVFQIVDYTEKKDTGTPKAFTSDYTAQVGTGGVKNYPDVDKDSIIGYYTGEIVELSVVIANGDQITNGSLNEPPYHKLIE